MGVGEIAGMVTGRVTEEQRTRGLSFSIEREKFNIPVGAVNRRLNCLQGFKSQFSGRRIHFRDHALTLFGFSDDATLPDLAAAYFELRLDEGD